MWVSLRMGYHPIPVEYPHVSQWPLRVCFFLPLLTNPIAIHSTPPKGWNNKVFLRECQLHGITSLCLRTFP